MALGGTWWQMCQFHVVLHVVRQLGETHEGRCYNMYRNIISTVARLILVAAIIYGTYLIGHFGELGLNLTEVQ